MGEFDNSKASHESSASAKPAADSTPTWRLQLKKSLANSGYESGRAALQFHGDGTPDVGTAQEAFKGTAGSVPHGDRVGSAIGADLSGVTAYTGPEATQACEKLGAEAFTYGDKMAFRDPSPTPQLVAHEGKHAVHQGAAASNVDSLSTAGGASTASMEAEADDAMGLV